MPAFSIVTPITIKSNLQAIYASDEKCYALVTLSEIDLSAGDEEIINLRNTCSVDAEVTLPLEVYVLGVTDEWLKQRAADFQIYLDDKQLEATFHAEQSAEVKATLEKLHPAQEKLNCIYLPSGLSFKIADDSYELTRSTVEPSITDVTDNPELEKAYESSSSESDVVNEDDEESEEESTETMEFAIRLPENQLNTCSVHAIYAWHDTWYVLADLTVDPRLDDFAEQHPEENGVHAIEQLYTVEADKLPAAVEVYWVRYLDKQNLLSPDIQKTAGLVKVAVNGVEVPTASYASVGEKADQTLKALYPYQQQIDPLYLADLDDQHEASFSILPMDDDSDEYQLAYHVAPDAKKSLPEGYRISAFKDDHVQKTASINDLFVVLASAAAPTVEELADGVDVEVAAAEPAQAPVVEEPADDVSENVTAQSAPVPTPADECVSGIPIPCPNLFSYRTLYAAGIMLFAAGGYIGMKMLEQSSDQQQAPRI